jgi:hypothetical protein
MLARAPWAGQDRLEYRGSSGGFACIAEAAPLPDGCQHDPYTGLRMVNALAPGSLTENNEQ